MTQAMLQGLKAAAAAAPLLVALGGGGAQAQSTWDWSAAIYLWGADLGTRTENGATAEIDFKTLLENLNFGAMAAVAGKRDEWTMFGDFIYLNVNTTEDAEVNVGPLTANANVDVQLAGFISTLGAAYEVAASPTSSFNVLGGVRYLWLESELNFNADRRRFSEDLEETSWDAVVGVRGTFDFSDKWYMTYYADVGGGQSDLTWQALGSVNYRFENVDLALGYRYTEWQFSDFGPFEELSVSGPFAGVRFSF